MALAFQAQAQSSILSALGSKRAGEGTVVIHQDARLNSLLQGAPAPSATVDESDGDGTSRPTQVARTAGFRVQVYAGNNSRQARTEANQMAAKVKEYFPEMHVYTHFINPRWLCRIGDFRSIEEADAAMRKLKETGQFREVSIVRAMINIPY